MCLGRLMRRTVEIALLCYIYGDYKVSILLYNVCIPGLYVWGMLLLTMALLLSGKGAATRRLVCTQYTCIGRFFGGEYTGKS